MLHIVENIKPPVALEDLDKPVWMLETKGDFSVKSSWEYLRKRRDPNIAYNNMWIKSLPFKMSFLMWRVWKGKLPLDDTVRRWGYFMPSRCWCCTNPEKESLDHLFFKSAAASRVWSYFFSFAGLSL